MHSYQQSAAQGPFADLTGPSVTVLPGFDPPFILWQPYRPVAGPYYPRTTECGPLRRRPMRTRIRFTAATIAIAMVVLVVPQSGAHAMTLSEIQARIKTLQGSLSKVGYQLSDADDHLVYLRTQIANHYTALRTANARRAQIQQSLSARAAQLYVLGGQGTPESLATDGIGPYVQRMTYLEQIGYTQQSLLEELNALQVDAKVESATLSAEEKDAQTTVNLYASSARNSTRSSRS